MGLLFSSIRTAGGRFVCQRRALSDPGGRNAWWVPPVCNRKLQEEGWNATESRQWSWKLLGRGGLAAPRVLWAFLGLRQEQQQQLSVAALPSPPSPTLNWGSAGQHCGLQLPAQPSSETWVTAQVPLLPGTCSGHPSGPDTQRIWCGGTRCSGSWSRSGLQGHTYSKGSCQAFASWAHPNCAKGEQVCEMQPLPDPLPLGEVSLAWACCFVSVEERLGPLLACCKVTWTAGRVTAAVAAKIPSLVEVGHGGIWVGTEPVRPCSGASSLNSWSVLALHFCLHWGFTFCSRVWISALLCAEHWITVFGLELNPSANSCVQGRWLCPPPVHPPWPCLQPFSGLLQVTWGENLPTSGLKSTNVSEEEV